MIEIVREVPLSQEDAWRRLTDWERHALYVPLTTIRLTAEGFVARTAVGRLGFDDPMEVVEFDPPSFCRLEKRGNVVAGWAELHVSPVGSQSRIVWREDIRVAWTPKFSGGLTKAVSRRLFSRVIDGLLSN
ncbi:MAG: SRPBCC family protein [Aeromicrobium sp.]